MKLLLIVLLSTFIFLCYSSPFSLAIAKDTLYLSYAAYCGNNVNANWNCYWCKNRPSFVWVGNFGQSKGAGFGFIGYDPNNKTLYVSFRGTDNLKGWISDFQFLKVNYPGVNGAQVHQGIFKAYLEVKNEIKSLFSVALSKCTTCDNVIVTGHSLGAAISVFGALDIRTYSNKLLNVYNFGCPRVGNTAFANYADSVLTVWRMANNKDPVPHLPFKIMNYYHIKTEIFERYGQYKQCSGNEDPTCIDSVKITTPIDHGEYMDIKIWPGIPNGCLYTDPSPMPQWFYDNLTETN